MENAIRHIKEYWYKYLLETLVIVRGCSRRLRTEQLE